MQQVLKCPFALSASAQITSTIAGTVTDKQGLAIVAAQVRAEGLTVVGERSATTDSSGEYHLPALPAGTYRLTVTRSGFRTGVYDGIEVTLNRTVRYDVQLEVGSTRDHVEVSGELPLLETQSSAQSTTIMPQEISDIPINGIFSSFSISSTARIQRPCNFLRPLIRCRQIPCLSARFLKFCPAAKGRSVYVLRSSL